MNIYPSQLFNLNGRGVKFGALYSMNKSFLNYHSDRKVISRIAESQYSVVKRLGP